jgi:hypothetical protein
LLDSAQKTADPFLNSSTAHNGSAKKMAEPLWCPSGTRSGLVQTGAVFLNVRNKQAHCREGIQVAGSSGLFKSPFFAGSRFFSTQV